MTTDITIKEETALTAFDAELAAVAAETASMEAPVLGQFFSVLAGQLSWDKVPIPGNQMTVVILDGVYENTFYGNLNADGSWTPVKYDASNKSAPACFSIGRSEKDLAPHPNVVAAQSAQSAICGISGQAGCCPWNELGSAENGKGKVCRNHRRLAILTASKIERDGSTTLIEDPEHFQSVTAGYLRVPPTSMVSYSKMVKTLDSSMHLPTFAVYCRIEVFPDPKNQVRVTFTPVKPVPADVLPVLLARYKADRESIMFAGQVMSKEDREAMSAAAEAEKGRSGRKRKFQK